MADVQVDVMEAGPITAGQVGAAAPMHHLNQPLALRAAWSPADGAMHTGGLFRLS
jgi:hypothetical protein